MRPFLLLCFLLAACATNAPAPEAPQDDPAPAAATERVTPEVRYYVVADG